MIIKPSVIQGAVRVPSSKSIGHRLLICAALADGVSEVHQLTMSKDIQATLNVLRALGAEIQRVETTGTDADHMLESYCIRGVKKHNRLSGTKHIIDKDSQDSDKNEDVQKKCVEINCSESGSTLRFFIPVGLALEDDLSFNGEGRLKVRPIDEYFPIFEKCQIKMTYSGELPLRVVGRLKPDKYELSGSVSSQYTTGMLLAAPLLEGNTEIYIQGNMESKGYIDLTIDCMEKFGIHVQREGYNRFIIDEREQYSPTQVNVEGDFSQAAFWIAAGLIGTKIIEIAGLNPNTVQGDSAIIHWVTEMGGIVEWHGETLKAFPSQTRGVEIDASQCPDLVPILCVLASQSIGETRIINGQRLRVKESDRIKSTVSELAKLGADIVETDDGMIIQGKSQLKGGCEIFGWNDHRIVMAMTVAATVCMEPIIIEGHKAVDKSYPEFFNDFQKLGGVIEEINIGK